MWWCYVCKWVLCNARRKAEVLGVHWACAVTCGVSVHCGGSGLHSKQCRVLHGVCGASGRRMCSIGTRCLSGHGSLIQAQCCATLCLSPWVLRILSIFCDNAILRRLIQKLSNCCQVGGVRACAIGNLDNGLCTSTGAAAAPQVFSHEFPSPAGHRLPALHVLMCHCRKGTVSMLLPVSWSCPVAGLNNSSCLVSKYLLVLSCMGYYPSLGFNSREGHMTEAVVLAAHETGIPGLHLADRWRTLAHLHNMMEQLLSGLPSNLVNCP